MTSLKKIVPPEPVVPEALEAAITAYLRPVQDGRGPFLDVVAAIPVTAATRIAALIAAVDAHLLPTINKAALMAWLAPLCDAVGVAPADQAVLGRIAGVLAAAPLLPLACLNARSFAAAIRAFTWFPSAKELVDFLEGQAALLVSRRNALQAVHDGILARKAPAPEPETTRPPPTPEEIAAVSRSVTDMKAHFAAEARDREATEPLRAKPPLKSGHLDNATLAAILRRDINQAEAVGLQVPALRARRAILERTNAAPPRPRSTFADEDAAE